MIKKLLSLPANLVGSFHNIEHADPNEWFCTSDPSGTKVGSGGGTAWLLEQSYRHDTDSSAIAPESREVPNRQVIPWQRTSESSSTQEAKAAGCQLMLLPGKYSPPSPFSVGHADNASTRTCSNCNYRCSSK